MLTLYQGYNWYWTDLMDPLKMSDGGIDGVVPQVHYRYYRHAITATARQEYQMIYFTHCQPVPAGGHSMCLYVKPWWLVMHSIFNPMQAPGGEGVLPTPLEQQRNWLQAVACVGTVQRKGGFTFKA